MKVVRAIQLTTAPWQFIKLPRGAELLTTRWVDDARYLFVRGDASQPAVHRHICLAENDEEVLPENPPRPGGPDYVDTFVIPGRDGWSSRVVHVFAYGEVTDSEISQPVKIDPLV